jgi:perosamine synthetase
MTSFKYPVYKPLLSGREREYVNDCLDTTWISSKGKYVSAFETQFANYIGVKHAFTVSNGTVAIHLALLALGIGPGDEVIVPTFTYVASVNTIMHAGATPVFADSESDYWQVCPRSIRAKITPKTKAIMVVHLYGHPCEMDEITKIAEEFNLRLIEDCAEAVGSEFLGRKIGSFGDVATFSFFGNKTITTGEGGMVVTNSDKVASLCFRLRGQGLADSREYWHDIIGYNYRMTNICAAIGLAQLEMIDSFVAKKRLIADWYRAGLAGLPLKIQGNSNKSLNSYWMVTALLDRGDQRDALRAHLKSAGIETRPTFYPVHTMPMYSSHEPFPVADSLGARGINLPSYPALTQDDIETICDAMRSYFS